MRLEPNFQENMTKENEASLVYWNSFRFAINLLFSFNPWTARDKTIRTTRDKLSDYTINNMFEKPDY